jgi:phosphoglycolate phosphatase
MRNNRIEAVLFDCDGVLVDSREANVATYRNVLRHAGYPAPADEDILACFHMTGHDTVERLTGTRQTDEVERVLGLLRSPELRTPELIKAAEGAEEVLARLAGRYTLGMVTSRGKLGVADVFRVTDFEHYFETVVRHGEYRFAKPHPEPLLLAAERLGISATAAVYVGDSHTDIEAAGAAGMASIHLATLTHPAADMGISHITELPRAIHYLEGRNAHSYF